jgi:NAD(P)-dependent dehydrogenase (short-subunit alcohol dehydrogenase family)
MAPLGGGSIVNLSSTATKRGSPDQWVHYAATKGAIDVLTAGLAAEVAAQGIRVNAVAPGLTLSDPAESGRIAARLDTMRGEIPMNRAGTADEVAEAVFWLCSDAASYVTGVVLPVAGGR